MDMFIVPFFVRFTPVPLTVSLMTMVTVGRALELLKRLKMSAVCTSLGGTASIAIVLFAVKVRVNTVATPVPFSHPTAQTMLPMSRENVLFTQLVVPLVMLAELLYSIASNVPLNSTTDSHTPLKLV